MVGSACKRDLGGTGEEAVSIPGSIPGCGEWFGPHKKIRKDVLNLKYNDTAAKKKNQSVLLENFQQAISLLSHQNSGESWW